MRPVGKTMGCIEMYLTPF